MSYRRLLYIFIIGIVCFLLLNENYTHAAGLKIQPIKVSHTIEQGESVSGIISLKNAGNNRINVEVTVEDFIPSAGTTDIKFVGRAEGNTTALDWISLDIPEDFVFEINGSRSIPYTIQVPLDAEPGGHYSIAFFKATEIADTGSLKVGTRVGMLIFITVPGSQLQKGRILGFSSPKFIQKGPVNFKIKFENTGTVHFEPKGRIKISNIFGKEVGEVLVQGQVVLPTGVRDLTAQWNVAGFLLGRYKAELSVVDGEGNVLTADSITFYAFPIWYILGFLIIIAVLFFGLKFLRSRLKFSISLKK